MNKDPYKVLGVSPNADDAEIKRAYHELAKKYHPDNCQDDDLRDIAAEKMKEVNEAYDAIKTQRAGKQGSSGGYGSANYDSQGYTSSSGDPLYIQIRTLLNENRVGEADNLLESVPYNQRGAEWCFLKGVLFMRLGRYFDAIRMMETACRNDPNNQEYRATLDQLRAATANRQNGYYNGGQTTRQGGCSNCDLCSSLICADCCCECMGGDLIRCC